MSSFSHTLCFLLLAVIFLVVPTQAKTKEEWNAHINKTDTVCRIELNGKYAGDKLAQLLVESNSNLPREVACYLNCFEQKSLEVTSYGAEYNKRWQESMSEMLKDDPKLKASAVQIFEACKGKVGKDDCDTAALRFFCKKELAIKMGIMK